MRKEQSVEDALGCGSSSLGQEEKHWREENETGGIQDQR